MVYYDLYLDVDEIILLRGALHNPCRVMPLLDHVLFKEFIEHKPMRFDNYVIATSLLVCYDMIMFRWSSYGLELLDWVNLAIGDVRNEMYQG